MGHPQESGLSKSFVLRRMEPQGLKPQFLVVASDAALKRRSSTAA